MKHASSRAPDLLHGPVFSNMTRFFLPIMLGSLLQQLYSMVDAVVLGRLVGKTALAAVGGSDLAIINLVVGFFVGLASGACVVVSQHYGAGEDGAVRRAVHTAILFSVVIGAVMTALGIGLARPILVLLDPPADTLEDSIVYLQWYFAGMIPSMVYNMGAGILRAVGEHGARPALCRRLPSRHGRRGHRHQPVAADLRGARGVDAGAHPRRLPPAAFRAAL